MHNKLDANINKNPNHNYKSVSTFLQIANAKHIPKRVEKFSKCWHKKGKCMTNKLRFKGYEKLVLKEIEIAKKKYFGRVLAEYRSDMKKTWQVISETLKRNKKINFLQNLFMRTAKYKIPR